MKGRHRRSLERRQTTEAALKQFRGDAERVGPGAGRKFPARLKVLGAEYARSRREAGASWDEVAKELGVVAPTVQRWLKTAAARRGTFHEVAIVQRAARATYSAVLPGGLRIEVLEFDAVVALARALS